MMCAIAASLACCVTAASAAFVHQSSDDAQQHMLRCMQWWLHLRACVTAVPVAQSVDVAPLWAATARASVFAIADVHLHACVTAVLVTQSFDGALRWAATAHASALQWWLHSRARVTAVPVTWMVGFALRRLHPLQYDASSRSGLMRRAALCCAAPTVRTCADHPPSATASLCNTITATQ